MKITIHYALWQCKYYYMEMLNRLYRLPLRTQANKRSRISLCGAAMARSLPNVIGNRIKFTVILSGRSHIFYFISLNWQTTSQRRRTNAPEKMRRWRRGNRRRRRKKWDKCEMRSEKQCMLLLKCHCYSHRRNKMRRNAVCLYITVSITLCRVAAEKWRQRKMCVWGHRVWCSRTRTIFAICCVCETRSVQHVHGETLRPHPALKYTNRSEQDVKRWLVVPDGEPKKNCEAEKIAWNRTCDVCSLKAYPSSI